MSESGRPPLPSKLYFRIGEVATLVGVEPHVLRYWEREFRSIRPAKSARGQRVYSRRDVESLMRVRELLYRDGFTVTGAKKKLAEEGGGDGDGADTDAEAAAEAHAGAASPASARAREDNGRQRARDELLAMRSEIEAFLVELGR
ncbi:MAG: MerR family transcriptional regulator [Myxococcales bacterium]|nr:MerR family transcriptional regulator [Myxococcales bacterium]